MPKESPAKKRPSGLGRGLNALFGDAAIEAPVLVIAADPSPPYFSPEVRTQRLACLADGALEVIPGGHHLHMEQAARVAVPLRAFLAG